jgi:phage terminase small subunit
VSVQKAPSHLSPDMQAWWRALTKTWGFDQPHLRILQAAAESWDRMVQAQALVTAEGLTVVDRFGQAKIHPAFGVERDSRVAFLRAVRELALSDDDMPLDSRPPRLARRYKGRE